MASRDQVLGLLEAGADYHAIADRLGISPGLAFLIATGLPADGSDAPAPRTEQRPGWLASSQRLSNPAQAENPTDKNEIRRWIKTRALSDTAMQAAARQGDKADKEA